MSNRITIAVAALALCAGLPTMAFANSTGNASNNPAVIQGYLPVPQHVEHQRSAVLRDQGPVRKVCDFNGSESGSRNPDYVICYN